MIVRQYHTKEMRKEQEKHNMSHGDYREQRKASNHRGARELGPVQKDPEFSVFNCPWWLLVSHAWQCPHVSLLPASVHSCQPSLQVMNVGLGPWGRGGGIWARVGGWAGWRNTSEKQSNLSPDVPQHRQKSSGLGMSGCRTPNSSPSLPPPHICSMLFSFREKQNWATPHK